MQKIDQITSTADENGEFTNGVVAQGKVPTLLDALWFNTIQRELVNTVEGAGLALNPNDFTQISQAIKLLANIQITQSGLLKTTNTIVMNSSGTYTPTAGTQFIIVEGVGGGGAGGGALVTTSNNVSCGSGGGAGGYCKTRLSIGEIGDSVEVTVGARGIGTNGGNGGNGSDTVFGNFFTAAGGAGGYKAGQSSGAFAAQGGVGGWASGGNILNSHGAQGVTAFANYGSYVIPGQGGDSVLGCGGRFMFIATGGAGHNGAGGGGVAIGTGATGSYIGGDGGDGVVIITEYIF